MPARIGAVADEASALGETRPQFLFEQSDELLGCLGKAAQRQCRGVVADRGADVRQPFEPVPRAPRGGREGGEDAQLAGRVEGGELDEQRAQQRPGALGGADDGHDAVAAERDRQRHVRQARGAIDQAPRGAEQFRVVFGQWVAAQIQAHAALQRHHATSDSHGEEVIVAGPPLPEPLSADDQRPDLCRLRIEPRGRLLLGGSDAAEVLAEIVEVGEIARPLAALHAALLPVHEQRESG